MSGYLLKNANAVLDYSFDWDAGLFAPGEAISVDQGWTIVPDEPGGLTVSSSSSGTTVTTVFLSGGESGAAYLVSSRVVTSQGREMQRSLTVRIGNN